MTEWILTIEAKSTADDEVDLARLSELAQQLRDVAGSVNGGGNSYGVVVQVRGTAAGAIRTATSRFSKQRDEVGLPPWPIVRCELIERDEFMQRIAAVPGAELAGTAVGILGAQEVSSALHISRQRVMQISTRPDFPAPIARLAATPVWSAASILRYAENRNTAPGRPPAGWTRVEPDE
ncbi:MAG TPA: hypothetical protein VIJ31_07310 [Acidothermaceae bacterium]